MHTSTNDDGGIYLTAKQVCARYGGVTPMTLARWLNDPQMDFPRPRYFGRLRFFRLDELEAWERDRPRRHHGHLPKRAVKTAGQGQQEASGQRDGPEAA